MAAPSLPRAMKTSRGKRAAASPSTSTKPNPAWARL
jgi:hypothetical protein